MKKLHTLLTLCLLALLAVSCGSDSDDEPVSPAPQEPEYITGIGAIVPPTATFAEDDGARTLNGSPAENLAELLEEAGPGIVEGLGYVHIEEDEYEEIKAFTDQLVEGAKTPKEVYERIFGWITGNIKYVSGYVDNDPYPVFQTRQAICQGYANLLKVMLHSQDVPCLNTNGMLIPVGGHAWNYVWLDEWYVSDPTNNGHFPMKEFSRYKHLEPSSLEADLFEDESYVFSFYEKHLNIREVKKSGKQLVLPFSTHGFRVTSFNPDTSLPEGVEEIYIGKNIGTLGENLIGLNLYAPEMVRAYVEESNPKLEGYGQLVYRNSTAYYVPASASVIQCKDIATLEKNFLFDHPNVETVVIQPGTKKIEVYAFEKCPELKIAYIPEGTAVDANAFYHVHSTFKIVRGIVKD